MPLTLQTQCRKGDTTAVEVSLEVAGDLKLTADGKAQSLPLKVAAQFAYDEARLDDCGTETSRRAARFYSQAKADFQIDKQSISPHLADGHELMLMEQTDRGFVISSVSGPLTREELDLVDIPGNTVAVDCLLPTGEVKVGDDWKPSDKPLAQLLSIDVVSRNDVKCALKQADEESAQIAISGSIAGAATGVSTEMEIDGKARYDLTAHRLVSLQLRIKEQRSAGYVSPAVDVTAKLNIRLKPLEKSQHLTPEVLSNLPEPAKEASPLVLRSEKGGFELLYDRRWHITREEPEVTVLRLVDKGELIAQCNISPLTKQGAGQESTLERFQVDIQKALGNHFASFDSLSRSKNAAGLTVFKAVVSGKVSDLPIEWRYYLILDDAGHKVAVTYTMESSLVERLAELDAGMIDSLTFAAGETQ